MRPATDPREYTYHYYRTSSPSIPERVHHDTIPTLAHTPPPTPLYESQSSPSDDFHLLGIGRNTRTQLVTSIHTIFTNFMRQTSNIAAGSALSTYDHPSGAPLMKTDTYQIRRLLCEQDPPRISIMHLLRHFTTKWPTRYTVAVPHSPQDRLIV